MLNNPINASDPSGHKCTGEPEECLNSSGRPINGSGSVANTGSQTIPTNTPEKDKDDGGKPVHKSRHSSSDNSLPDGFQIQFTIALAIPIDNPPKSFCTPAETFCNTQFALFYGGALVFDKYGGIQLYGLTLDQTDYGTNLGPLQEQNGTTMLAANAVIAAGVINGTGFEEKGTEAYEGQARDWSGGLGPVGVDFYHGYNPKTGKTDPSLLNGIDIGYSPPLGLPISFGDASIYAHHITQRYGPPIP